MKTHQTTRLAGIIGILLVSFAIFYYFVIFLPEKERREIEAKEKAYLDNKTGLENCLNDARNKYLEGWKRACESKNEESECSLSPDLAMRYDQVYKDLREECLKQYPQK